ncbi:MAG: hypothetical protein Q9165_007985 [Trypethelium subeluteriae]
MATTALPPQPSLHTLKQISLNHQHLYTGSHPAKLGAPAVQHRSANTAMEGVERNSAPAPASAPTLEAAKSEGIAQAGDQDDRTDAGSVHQSTFQSAPSAQACDTPIRPSQRQEPCSQATDVRCSSVKAVDCVPENERAGLTSEIDPTSRKRSIDQSERRDDYMSISPPQQTSSRDRASVPHSARLKPSTSRQLSRGAVDYDKGIATDGESTGSCELDDTDASSGGEEYKTNEERGDSVANGSVRVRRKRSRSRPEKAPSSQGRAPKSRKSAAKLAREHQRQTGWVQLYLRATPTSFHNQT